MDTEPILVTPEQAAEVLAIGRTRVYELMGRGQLESVRIGASRRIPVTALHDFVSKLQVTEHGHPDTAHPSARGTQG
ncbi:MAG TPA: helix-turn-helix domain-containing protein [Acidimicrobiales bacterium]|jgi:excisionase family DNA binding protein